MSENALRRLSVSLTIPLLLAASATVALGQEQTQPAQSQERTQSTQTQERPQRSELLGIAGVLIKGNEVTLQKGFELVKLSDNSVGVRRFGGHAVETRLTCVCAQGSGGCNMFVYYSPDGKYRGARCENAGCQKCELEAKQMMTPP